MKINWRIEKTDLKAVHKVLLECDQDFLNKRKNKNIEGVGIVLNEDSIIHAMLLCLLTTQQKSGKGSNVQIFLNQKPFPIAYAELNKSKDLESYLKSTLKRGNLSRFINRISGFFSHNFNELERSNWELKDELEYLRKSDSKAKERELADTLQKRYKGFGPKQARNFLQYLGLTKYEIPIDSRVTRWLNQELSFPIKIKASPLSDKGYYHFVSDGIQELCFKADTKPCLLDAAIFSMADVKRNMRNRG